MNLLVLDIPRFYTGLAEWLACMVFAQSFRLRVPKKWFFFGSGCALILQCAFLMVTDDVSLVLWVPCMAVAAGMMFTLILTMWDVDLMTAAYTTVRAFILAEFAAALEWQIHRFFWPVQTPEWYRQHGLLILVYAAIFALTWLIEKKCTSQDHPLAITWQSLLTVTFIGISVFALSNLSFYIRNSPFSSHYASEIMIMRTMVDLAGVTALFACHILFQQAQAKQELDAMQTILENQYAQYRMSRESIDMINRKYHDLKHMIIALRADTDPQSRNQRLDDMEADIRSYEAQNKTGNSILDTVLTGKSLYCQKHGIELSVVADGEIISFLDVMDICTIFGNALDNAIECELKIPEKEKRLIHLRLTGQKQFLLLQVENYCPTKPEFQGGLPVTTKSDNANHGFGLKSIQYAAKKYCGTVTVEAQNDWFVLKVLIPLRETNGT